MTMKSERAKESLDQLIHRVMDENRSCRERLEQLNVKDYDPDESDDSDELHYDASAIAVMPELDEKFEAISPGVRSDASPTSMARRSPLRHIYFIEMNKQQYLKGLLSQLNRNHDHLNSNYSPEQIEQILKNLKEKAINQQQEKEKKLGTMIMTKMDQIKNMEVSTKNLQKELDSLTEKYQRLMDKDYLEDLGKKSQKVKNTTARLKREQVLLKSQTKQVERKIDNKARLEVDKKPFVDLELKNLKSKLVYMKDKYEKESENLISIVSKQKNTNHRV